MIKHGFKVGDSVQYSKRKPGEPLTYSEHLTCIVVAVHRKRIVLLDGLNRKHFAKPFNVHH